MRLKTFTAPTMTEAMALVKEHMGADAIIVSTQDIPGSGVRLTAALDRDPDLDDDVGPVPALQEQLDVAEAALTRHNLPDRLRIRLCDLMARETAAASAQQLLAGALDEIFDFAPLPEKNTPRALAFVGPPGSGKTLAVAKTAARAVMKKRKVTVLSTDYKRAGGNAQLMAFTKILRAELLLAKSPEELKARFAEIRDADVILVDTASCNPYKGTEIGTLCEFMKAIPSETILVNPAGIDAYESADIANAFADGGATRVMISRLDVAARLGGALYGADSGNLSLCNVSMTAQVADGLAALSPLALAKLLIPSHRADTAKPSFSEVVK